MTILRTSRQKFGITAGNKEIQDNFADSFVPSFFLLFSLGSLVVYFAWVRGHVSFDSSMDYSSLNCMHAARILTVMF